MRVLLSALLATSLSLSGSYAQDTDAPPNTRQQVQQLIQQGELEKALEAIESGDIAPSAVRNLRRSLASGYMRQRQMDKVYSLYEKNLLETIENAAGISDLGGVQIDVTMVSNYAPATGNTEAALAALDKGLAKLQTLSISDDERNSIEFPMALAKVNVLSRSNDSEAAGKIVEEYLARARQLTTANPDSENDRALLYNVLETGVRNGVGGDAETLIGELRQMASDELQANRKSPAAVSRFMGATGMAISRLMEADPSAVEAVIEDARTKISAIKEANEEEPVQQITQILSMFERNLNSMEARVESAKILANLIGNPAPAIDAQYWVNGTATDLEALKGKVVLIDFWAVWCGPCIATFPHLRSLHDEFASEGLEIIGITRKYNYAWDEEAKRASRAEEEQSDEAEIAMLEKFLAHHELQHPTVVTPPGSEMNKNYGVSGIPHVVLIDKQGVVRMYKVGSGEANAKAIHEKVVELLAE